jgi:hypothetical protein
MTGSLPQYESSILAKVATVRELTIDRVESLQGVAGRMFHHLSEPEPAPRGAARPAGSSPRRVPSGCRSRSTSPTPAR